MYKIFKFIFLYQKSNHKINYVNLINLHNTYPNYLILIFKVKKTNLIIFTFILNY